MAVCTSVGASRLRIVFVTKIFSSLLLIGGLLSARIASAQTFIWIGGTSNWNNAANWNPASVPDGSAANVFIDNGNTGVNSAVTLDIVTSVGALTIDAGDSLSINNAASLSVNAGSFFTGQGTLTVNGALNMNSGGNVTDLEFIGTTALNGSGTITMGNNTANRIYGTGANVLTVASTMTIQGAGQIGVDDLTMTNNGVIDANVTNSLTLQPLSTSSFTNSSTGTLEATAGGTLIFASGSYNNSGIIQSVGTGSNVNFAFGAAITGGTITTSTGGAATVTGNSSFSGITNSGTIGVNNGQTMTISGTILNNGAIQVNSTGNLTNLWISGPVSLNGTGVVTLDNNTNNTIEAANNMDRLTVGSSMTIQGAGQIGAGDMSLTNNGTIDANVSGSLTVQPNSAGDFTNTATGIMEATSGGTLQFNTGTYTNNGTIESVGTGSNVKFGNAAAITGGIITTSTGGAATVTGDSSFSGITNSGTIGVNNNQTMTIAGTITNNGTIQVNSTGNQTNLWISGAVSLNGSGSVTLDNNTNNTIEAANNTDRLTVGSSMTIQGAGQIGVGDMAMTNNGTIDANVSGTLTLQPDSAGDFTNSATGTMEATSGGTLTLNAGTYTNDNVIQSDGTGSTVNFNGSTITGGTVTTTNSGAANVTSNSTFSGITNNGTIGVNNNRIMTVSGTIIDNGTIALNSNANDTDLQISGPVALNGTGFVTLSNNSNNRIYAANNTDRLTVGSSITIQGAGQFGIGDLAMTNNGTINANISGGTLLFQPNGTEDYTNTATGTWEATNGGILKFVAGTYNNNNVIEAVGTDMSSNPSQVQFNGSTISGGTITTSGGGVANVISNSTFSNITNTGTIGVNNNIIMTVTGTLTNNGTINLNSTGNLTDLQISGPVSLAGTGFITLSNNSNNRIYAANSSDILTVGANETIQGEGQIGVGDMSLSNSGTIDANVNGGQLVILPNSPGAMNTPPGFASNSGTWEASNGGILVLQGGAGSFSSTGTLEALDGSEVRVAGGANISGTLSTTGTGIIHNTSGATLNGVTNNGTFTQDNNTVTTLQGTITNNGSIKLNSTGNLTDISISGPVTINGTGSVILGNNTNNRIYAANDADRLTVGSSQTIEGAGQIGVGDMSMTNNGTIDANVSQSLTLQPNGSGDFTNGATGVMEATSGGTLILVAGPFDNNNIIKADGAGSNLQFNGSTVTGGTIDTTNSGTATVVSSSTFNGVTNNGTIGVNNNLTMSISGTITNNGTIQLNSSGNLTNLQIVGATTIAGTGAVILGANSNNRVFAANNIDTLTIGQNQTIEGEGQLGVQSMALTNNGTVNANTNGQTLVMLPNGNGFTNNGTGLWEASSGGTLSFAAGGGSFTNNGTIQANDGSTVNMDSGAVLTNNSGGTLNGGTYAAVSIASAAVVNLSGGNVTNNNATVTLNGSLASIPVINTIANNQAGGVFNIFGGKAFSTAGALANLGIVNVGPSSTLTIASGQNYSQTAGTTIIDGILATSGGGTGQFAGGILKGSGKFTGNLNITNGTNVEPGDSPGTLTDSGNYAQDSDSTLDIEIGSGTLYDVLDVTGNASIAGTLNVSLLNGFVPTVNETFDIVRTGGLTGEFSTENFGPPGITYSTQYTPTDVILTVTGVPEPSVIGLLAVGAIGLLRRRRTA